ncbi:unnamed protein product [Schistosoma rodhaini]|uniref:Uncharacterized protein n=1 Tax=Schistosoma rodhaini TaxID=6188 RepID=A0AA85EUB0_9TREM|nr:unnamed protein product [Schistosoma rodhaini]
MNSSRSVDAITEINIIFQNLTMFRINKSMNFTCDALFICLVLLVTSTLSMRTNNDLMDFPEYSPEYELHIYDHIEYHFIKIILRKKIVKLINHFILIMVK